MACRRRPDTRSRRRPPTRPARAARARSGSRSRRAGAGTASRPGPSHRPRPPTRGRGRRRTRGRRRRCRRTRGAYPPKAASAISSSAISSAASGLAIERIAALIDFSRAGWASSSSTSAGTRPSSGSGTTTAPPPRSKWRAFRVWWSEVACGYGTRIGRRARGGELPDGAARPRDREVGCREGGAELGGRRHEHVVAPVHATAQALVVALAGDVQYRRALVAVGVDGEVVEAARAGERAEEGDHRCLPGQVETATAFFLRDAAMVGRHRPAGDAVLRAVAPRDAVGEEDAARERRRQPVGESEMRIRLRQCGRELLPPGRVDHRPGDVAAAAEDDMRPPPLQDRRTRPRRATGPQERPEQRHRRTAREARDLERVELVPGLRDEPSLDPIRRPGERHADASVAQRRCDRERRQDVPGCSAGGDQGSQLAGGRGHRQRC